MHRYLFLQENVKYNRFDQVSRGLINQNELMAFLHQHPYYLFDDKNILMELVNFFP